MEHLKHYFNEHPVIAGVRNEDQINQALNSDVIVLFVLDGDIFTIPGIAKKIKEHDKLVFLHIDLIEGLASDYKAVKYLAQNEFCDGIVSTKGRLIRAAKKEGLMAVQRLFLLDSAAIKSGHQLMKNNKPDAVEILPGVAAPHFLESINTSCPVIGGGLIRTRNEINELVEKGVFAVSTSKEELWFKE